MRDTLVIGLGNPLRGDDGVGVVAAEILAGRVLPDGVQVEDGGNAGLELANLMEGWSRVILVDAGNVGRKPGEFARFAVGQGASPVASLLDDSGPLSVHDAGLGDALRLAEALGVLPQQVVVFGMQPADIAWTTGLSPQVSAGLPALIEAIVQELGGSSEESACSDAGTGSA